MAQTSIRDLVEEKIAKFRDVDALGPAEVAQEVVELSSLWASVNKELVDRRCWYAEVVKKFLIEHGTAAKAKIYAEATPEYRQLIEAEAYSKSVQEMIRSGKRYVNLAEAEKRESVFN